MQEKCCQGATAALENGLTSAAALGISQPALGPPCPWGQEDGAQLLVVLHTANWTPLYFRAWLG